jgi:hypothetical protein
LSAGICIRRALDIGCTFPTFLENRTWFFLSGGSVCSYMDAFGTAARNARMADDPYQISPIGTRKLRAISNATIAIDVNSSAKGGEFS